MVVLEDIRQNNLKTLCLEPPTTRKFKIYFDVAHIDDKTSTRVVPKDKNGTILGAWVNHFSNDNASCVKTEVALEIAKSPPTG